MLFCAEIKHFLVLIHRCRRAQYAVSGSKFNTDFSGKVYPFTTSLSRVKLCPKIVQRNIKLMQNNNIMAKSRFTKYFYFLSTVFVDNFVDNDEINYFHSGVKVYDLLNIVTTTSYFTV